ncbi:hypothetical protein B5G34_14420 [Flavonifractor sp. An82]|uniref:hypothetical protein n=1 Tax=Flavonifractor sp. An82 TaxID=1965660 RepID=UPI000B3AB662|nr:hypothetical protein [Flavonifractor sp. An82]OUN20544.1 hypothetical protein B5G34_14420 [Flavonifractor sp. An82]
MERITKKDSAGSWVIPAEEMEAAAARLAAFEDAYERLMARQQEIVTRMEALKSQGKQKTAQFRELFGEKLMNQNTLTLWETYGVR